jgi:hypothetical protein
LVPQTHPQCPLPYLMKILILFRIAVSRTH